MRWLEDTTVVISYDAPTDFCLLTDTNAFGINRRIMIASLPTNGSFLNDAGYLTDVVDDTTTLDE